MHSTFSRYLLGILLTTLLLASLTPAAEAGRGSKKKSVAEEAKAKGETPVAAQVDVLTIPEDPSLPKYAVTIKPFDYSASGQISGGGQASPIALPITNGNAVTTLSPDGSQIITTVSGTAGPAIGKGISDQLRSALSGWRNISIVPPDAVTKNDDGTYSCKLQPGEVGPFIIEGTVTEFTETADASGKGRGINLRTMGWGIGLIGVLTGNRGVGGAGAGMGLLGPEFQKANLQRTGMVGMDIGIQDGRIARYVGGGTFSCQGSFTSVGAGSSFNIIGISSGKGEVAASSLGNATRAALNDALKKVHDAMVEVR